MVEEMPGVGRKKKTKEVFSQLLKYIYIFFRSLFLITSSIRMFSTCVFTKTYLSIPNMSEASPNYFMI